MKKKFTLSKYKKFNLRKSAKQLRRRIRSKEKLIERRNKYAGKSLSEVKYIKSSSGYKSISAPENFSLIFNTEQSIEFVNKLEKFVNERQKVFINLQKLTNLDHSAITVLLSTMFIFQAKNIPYNGNFPKDNRIKRILAESEFFKYLYRPLPNKIEYTIDKDDQIFTRANKDVNAELGAPIMMQASKTIWGEVRLIKGLQRVLLELMQNTNNHAAEKRGGEHWWLSVNHDKKNKRVKFIFVDYGQGIFESLKHKPAGNKFFGWLSKIKDRLIHGGNDEIFRMLLNGDLHRSVTGKHYRGKGLPGIKDVMDRNEISNLYIISNSVIADVSNDKYSKLNNEFRGTFVSWEINSNNKSIKGWI